MKIFSGIKDDIEDEPWLSQLVGYFCVGVILVVLLLAIGLLVAELLRQPTEVLMGIGAVVAIPIAGWIVVTALANAEMYWVEE